MWLDMMKMTSGSPLQLEAMLILLHTINVTPYLNPMLSLSYPDCHIRVIYI